MSFLLACLISPGGALLGALICLIFGAPLAVTVFTIFALPLAFIFILKIISPSEKDLQDYRNKLQKKRREKIDKMYGSNL